MLVSTKEEDNKKVRVKYDHISSLNLESAAFSKLDLTTSGLAKNVLASVASDGRLGMAEDGGCLIASSTLHIHEVGVGGRNEPLEFMLLLLRFICWMKEVSLHLW